MLLIGSPGRENGLQKKSKCGFVHLNNSNVRYIDGKNCLFISSFDQDLNHDSMLGKK